METRTQEARDQLQRTVSVLRERRWTIILTTLATLAAAAAFVLTAEDSYTASAEVLVKPVIPTGDTST